MRSLNVAYAELVRELDSPHVRKTPTDTFVSVLGALARLDRACISRVAWAAGTDQGGASRVLARMRRLGLAVREDAPGGRAAHGGRLPPRYYQLTEAGRDLARPLTRRSA